MGAALVIRRVSACLDRGKGLAWVGSSRTGPTRTAWCRAVYSSSNGFSDCFRSVLPPIVLGTHTAQVL